MKKKISILICIIAFSWQCFSQMDNYYFYRGEKIPIDINEEMYYVTTSDSAGLANYLATSNFQVIEKKKGIYFKNANKKYWKIIEVKSKNIKPKEVTTWLSSYTFVEQIYPVIGNEYPIAISDYFYVMLKSKDDFKILDSMASQMSCEIVNEVANMPLWYTLKSNKKSNALNLTNYFYATNFFQEVDPGFVFNFTNSCINDTEFDEQWGLKNGSGIDINACTAWEVTRGNPCVVIGVVDRGIDSTHNEFSSNLLSTSYDCENNSFPAQLEGDHGTHVAGIIGANQNANQISGVAPLASLMSISHSLIPSSTMSQELASGISWAWHNGADIINCSWGDQGGAYYSQLHSALLENAIDSALTYGRNGLGCIVLFASGNHSPTIDYPAYYTSDIICVGAINSSDSKAAFSAYGTSLDIVAPGVDILSTIPNNRTDVKDGTSMATPHAAGVAGLILSVNPDLSQDEVRNIIESTCTKVGNYSYTTTSGRSNGTWNNQTGYGCVNAYAALMETIDQMNIFISGPSVVCSSGASFTLNNPPQVDSIIWETGSYLTVYSGQNTDSPIIKATGNGRSWVQVRLVNDCGSITLPRQTVWAGTEMATTFSPFDLNQQVYTWYPLCVGTPYEFRASLQNPSENPSDYFWTVWDEEEELMYMCPSGTGGYFVASHSGFYTVNLIYNNGCGWGSERSVRFEFEECGGLFLLISPNPTTGETTLTIESGTESETLNSASVGEDTFDYNAEWDMEIYSPMQALKTKKTKLKGKSTTIQTAGWTEGVYTIRVKYKDEILTGKLIVKR